MKALIYFMLSFVLASCCMGTKCNQDYHSARFRIIDKATGQDLVFGASGMYDKDSITFFSVNGTDTVYHLFGAGANPNPGQDSLLYVTFDYRKDKTVFVRLNNSDVDTITLSYPTIDASPCCPDYSIVKPVSYNNDHIDRITNGVTILKK